MTLRKNVIVCGSLFVILIGTAIIGNVLQSAGMAPLSGRTSYLAMFGFFGLFMAFGFSAVPVMVKTVIAAQTRAGPVTEGLARHQNAIIYVIWGLMLAGSVIAIPAAVVGGLFGDAPRQLVQRALEGSSMGTLSAAPGMSLDEMTKKSTVPLNLKFARTAIAGKGAFEFVVPHSSIRFPRARSYFITTRDDDHTKINVVNISTSPEKGSKASLDAADAALRGELARDGWLAGHEVYRTAESQRLHEGEKAGPEGRQYLKDGIVFTINRNRMDEAQLQEDAATAGEWIQYIELWPADSYPGFERLVFPPVPGH
ncbi:MAG: hypothetical protein H0X40_06675 [Chthoniobacterales bacterium]|nr:hypothetical protein [Chthoniobacterales bacterium]